MSRRQLVAALGTLLVIMCGVGLFWRPTPSAAAQSVRLDGSARISQGRGATRLVLSATSGDASSLDLEASLDMSATQGMPPRSQTGRLTALNDRERGEGDDSEYRGRGVPGSTGPEMVAPTQAGGRPQADLSGVPDRAQISGGQSSTQPGQSTVAAVSVGGTRTGDPTFWHIARAAGLSAYLMLFLNVFLGLAVHTHYLEGVMARWRSFDLHQFTALLAIGFLGLHALALLGDRYMGFTPAQLVIPFASPYRPFWTALGVVGAYAVLIVFGSSYVRQQIGYRAWRAIHYVAFAAFLLTMVHGVFSGTDSGEPWAAALYAGTGATIALLTLMRFKGVAEQRTPAAPKLPVPARSERVPVEVGADRMAEGDGVRTV
ncbi:MAG TPA: hypothetical protein VHS28_03305 [Chloroflexota bacterium]|nr:hypothetical protein [Chloroflexota bacterium]